MSDNKPKFEVSKPAEKTEVTAPPTTKDIIKELMSEMLPAMAAAMQAGMNANRPVDPRAERVAVANGPKCHVCKQLTKACNGEHEDIVVYPSKYPEFGAWFRGVGINGIWYRSDNAGQTVSVPKSAVGDILQTVIAYEENERETRMGRVAEHNTGSLASPNRAGATAGWR